LAANTTEFNMISTVYLGQTKVFLFSALDTTYATSRCRDVIYGARRYQRNLETAISC